MAKVFILIENYLTENVFLKKKGKVSFLFFLFSRFISQGI